MNISSIVGRNTPVPLSQIKPDTTRGHPTSLVGIEIELEGMEVHDTISFWRYVHDGSLQNGIELVSKPIGGKAIATAMAQAKRVLKKNNPYLSFRTSVHVHINALDLTAEQTIDFIKLYIMYEPALFRLHKDWDRYDNIFCVPCRKSYAIQEAYGNLFSDLREGTIGRKYVGYKYSALNPNPLSSFGTLEFRHMGGCIDTDEILKWVDILLLMKTAVLDKTDVFNFNKVFGDKVEQLDIRDGDFEEGRAILDNIELLNLRG